MSVDPRSSLEGSCHFARSRCGSQTRGRGSRAAARIACAQRQRITVSSTSSFSKLIGSLQHRLQSELFLRGKAVLLASDVAFVFGARLVQLESTIGGSLEQAAFVRGSLGGAHWRESACDSDVLAQDAR